MKNQSLKDSIPKFKKLRYRMIIDSLTYPTAGIAYHEGVRYLVWLNDVISKPQISYLVMPISCKEFKEMMRGIVTIISVMDKHPFYRIFTEDIINDESDEPVVHVERLDNGIRDIHHPYKPMDRALMRYMPKLGDPSFYNSTHE